MVCDDQRDKEPPEHVGKGIRPTASTADSPLPTPSGDATRILSRIESGDAAAAEELLPLVYDELRQLAAAKLAQEKPGQTLQPTALVHEAYLRLVDRPRREHQHWASRRHFFAAAAEAMRRILINRARQKATVKRGGDWNRVTLDSVATPGQIDPGALLAFDELFDRLVQLDPQAGEIAKLRIFAGLTVPEVAEVLNLGCRTVERQWALARAWMRAQLKDH